MQNFVNFGETQSMKNEILRLFQMASSPDLNQTQRKQVDDELKQLGMLSIIQHVYDLCSIISEPTYDNHFKDFAVIHLKNYLTSNLNQIFPKSLTKSKTKEIF